MLQKLVEKMVNKALAKQSSAPDQSAEIESLKKQIETLKGQNETLKGQLESSGAAKRLAKLKEAAAAIPAGATGVGSVSIIEDGIMKSVPLKTKKDLEDVIARAEKNEIEVFSS